MVYTVKDLCGFFVDLLWIYCEFMRIYVNLCRFMRIYGGFISAKMDLWCTQFWADVYPSVLPLKKYGRSGRRLPTSANLRNFSFRCIVCADLYETLTKITQQQKLLTDCKIINDKNIALY